MKLEAEGGLKSWGLLLWEVTAGRAVGSCLGLLLFVVVVFRNILAIGVERIVRQRVGRRLVHVLSALQKTLSYWFAGLGLCSKFTLFVCPEWSLSGGSVPWMLHLVAE